MHFVIEGKPNISKFVQVIKLFSHSLYICDQDKMQFLDMKSDEKYNDVSNARNPAYFAQLNKEMFYDYQTQIRENHLKFAESNCSNIQLQQEICQLNSQLKYICCELPTNLISKAIKPILKTRIKQLTMSFSYLLDERKQEKRITLNMIIILYSDIGTFQIFKPIQQLTQKKIELPILEKKIMAIDYENCLTILSQMKNEHMRIICTVDNIQIFTLENNQKIDIPSTQIDYYNSSYVEEIYGELKIDLIYGKTYQSILSFCTKMKERCTVYISPIKDYGLIYFTNQEENILLCCRQAVLINNNQEQQGQLFQQISQDENFLEEIEIISKQQMSQIKSQGQFQTTIQQPKVQEYSNSFQNEIKENNSKINNSITYEEQQGLFVPKKITGSINDAIFDFMKRIQSKQTDNTISKFT